MKKMKFCMVMLLMVVGILSLTGCSKRNDGINGTTGTSAATTAVPTTESRTQTSTTRNSDEEGSTGLVDEIIDDVERGVDDITGESNGRPTESPTAD